jgi:hypothetical protein
MLKLTAKNILRIGVCNMGFADHLVVRHMNKHGKHVPFCNFDHDLLMELYTEAIADAGLTITYTTPYPKAAPSARNFDLVDSAGVTLLSGGSFASEGDALKHCVIWTFKSVDIFPYLAASHAKAWDTIRSKNYSK